MKTFKVTALINGKVETWKAVGNSAGHVRQYVIDTWNAHLLYSSAKIISIVPLETTDD